MKRRLAAILATDVVGYSRLMGNDEAGTHRALMALRQELIDPVTASHDGRVVKSTGDGVLAEFASVIDAVECAVELQKQMTARNAEVPNDRRIELRIGINMGDVIVEEGDIFGDGVNVAARLERLAEPGGVCVSGTVHDQVVNKIDVVFENLGERTLKNIALPVRTYRLVSDQAPSVPSSPRQTLLALPKRPAIAVLPFGNLSADPEQEYFSDGITEDIINALALWRSFPVIARNSSFAFKNRSSDVRAVAAELGARYVLEGSVRRSAQSVRVAAQLIDANTGHHLWADRFDRAIGDIFALQDEITKHIVAAIAPELLRAEEQRANQKRPTDLTAWDLILRAISAKAVGHGYGSKEGNLAAKKWLEQAISLEASAEAWAWRALCEWHDVIEGWVEDTDAALTRCIEAARRSVNQDDANWLAHSVLGIALLFGRRQADSAVDEATQAVRLNPSSSMARHILGCALDFAGRQEESIPHLEALFQLDPLYRHRAAAYADLALANLLLGNTAAAVAWASKAVNDDPEYLRARQRLVAALSAAGHVDEARAELQTLQEKQPGFSLDYVDRTYPFVQPKQATRFTGWLRKAGVT